MAAASLSDWSFHPVACAECEIPLQRRLLHPKTKEPIKRFFCNHVCKGNSLPTFLRLCTFSTQSRHSIEYFWISHSRETGCARFCHDLILEAIQCLAA